MRFQSLRALVGVCLLAGSAAAAEDAASVRYFRDLAETRSYSLGRPVSPKLTPDGAHAIFLRSGARDPVLRLYEMKVADGAVKELLTPEQILKSGEEQLTPEEKARRERQRQSLRGFTTFQLSSDGARVLVVLGGKLFVVTRADGTFAEMPGAGWIAPQLSPDGQFIGAVRGNELFVIEIAKKREQALTQGESSVLHHGVAEFIAQEELGRFEGFWWSPDSKFLAYQETDHTGVEIRYIADPLHPEVAPTKQFYPRPGTPNARVRLGVIARGGGDTRWIEWDHEKFPYLGRVTWKEEKAPLTLYVLDRLQQTAVLLAADPSKGSTRELLRETDSAWVNLEADQKPLWLADGSAFLWPSEQGGLRRLEKRKADGSLSDVVVRGEQGFAALVGLSGSGAGAAIVFAGGPDPRERQIYAQSLAGKSPPQVTIGSGMHDAVVSQTTTRALHGYNLMDGRAGWDVCEANGVAIRSLPSVAEKAPLLPRVELRRVKGEREYNTAVIKPRDFSPGQRYPVILDVYAGPHHQHVTANSSGYLIPQWYADHGYLVVRFDGRGTPGRGRDWERAIHGNLIDIPLGDQIDALHALAKELPEMDLTRVAVTGWSFGGYFSAMAAIQRPDVFACGVAGAPVVTWENYDTAYTERYLGLPESNPDAYRASSVLAVAEKLARPLLLIHGATDDNVYFQHSVQLADALYRAGKPYEFLPLLGTHMISDPMARLRREQRVLAFFDRHLKRETPASTPVP